MSKQSSEARFGVAEVQRKMTAAVKEQWAELERILLRARRSERAKGE